MAKKKKRSDRASFLFDGDAGTDPNAINLFGPDDEPVPEPEPAYDEETAAFEEPAASDAAPSEADEPIEAGETDEPIETGRADRRSDAPQFRFDRYGRRIGKHGARYGKRKNVP